MAAHRENRRKIPECPTPATVTERTLGRPRDPKKGQAIIAAARVMFLEEGYEAVAMEAVAAAAGVSKMTVYGHFQDKAALFAACTRANCDDMLVGFTKLDHQASKDNLEETLHAFGTKLISFILSAKVVSIFPRLLLSLRNDPVLAKTFYEAGPARTLVALATIIETAANRGELTVDTPLAAAEDLLSLWRGDLDRWVSIGVEPCPSKELIERRVQRGTDVFLRAYQAKKRTTRSKKPGTGGQ